jgi:hypothetical protein
LVLLLSSVFVLVELSVLVLVLLLSIVLVLLLSIVLWLLSVLVLVLVLVLVSVSVLVFVLVLLSVFTRAEESPVAEALAPLAVEVTEFVLSTVGSTAPATPDRPSARAKAAVVMMTFFMTSS